MLTDGNQVIRPVIVRPTNIHSSAYQTTARARIGESDKQPKASLNAGRRQEDVG